MLWFIPDIDVIRKNFDIERNVRNIWDFAYALPPIEQNFRSTMGEGGTISRNSEKIGITLGLSNLVFKDETQNPTSSFKDRAAALLISHARSWNFKKVICASNGNQGASIAAYASLENVSCLNIVPKEIDAGKKAQMIAYNSDIEEVGATVDDAIAFLRRRNDLDLFYQCTPEFNPLTMEAQKTISYEIFTQKRVPSWLVVPMGSGELLVSIWKGFKELNEAEIIEEIPKLIGVQSEISSPIVSEFLNIKRRTSAKKHSQTIASGVLVKEPMFKELAIESIKESEGTVVSISEESIVNSIDELIRKEGIFAEPASALTFAAVDQLNQENNFDSNDLIVCIITGSGLKAPYILETISSQAKTAGKGSIIITKLKILSQISLSSVKGITGTKIQELIGSFSLAAIYQHLKALEVKGLIFRKRDGKNVLYFITDSGKKVLDALDILITLL